jgi:GNAT superfamily N-acetyltransferase
MSTLCFRKLASAEFEVGYAIVSEATEWLWMQNLPAWLVPRDLYQRRHTLGENYGLLIDNELRAVVTLTAYHPRDWDEYLPATGFIWLATLAAARRFKGQGLGYITLRQAELLVRSQGVRSIYLDCYYSKGLLPQYYMRSGYQWLARKDLIFEDKSTHDSVLMFKTLAL